MSSGYNTVQALKTLPQFFPIPNQGRVRLMVRWPRIDRSAERDANNRRKTIFFGANDARLPNTPQYPQHVPLEQYRENIVKLATHEMVVAHKCPVVLITPAPIDERLCLDTDSAKGIHVMRRTAENTAQYAEVVRQLGKQLNLPVLDLWTAFMKAAGWKQGEVLPGSSEIPPNQVLVRLLHDGM